MNRIARHFRQTVADDYARRLAGIREKALREIAVIQQRDDIDDQTKAEKCSLFQVIVDKANDLIRPGSIGDSGSILHY